MILQKQLKQNLLYFIIYIISVKMLYNRNKECFKKTTTKVEHPEASRTILNLINSKISQSIHLSNDSILSQRSPHTPQNLPIEKFTQNNQFTKKIKYCSRLDLQHVIDIQIKHESRSTKAKEELINILEEKIKNMEATFVKDDTEKLYRFHQQARNLILSSCMELIQCKSEIGKQSRLKSVNAVLSKNEQFLEIQSNIINTNGQNSVLSQGNQLVQLRQLCNYQQKIISYLSQKHEELPSISEIKLLRHQINRISQQNQQLRARKEIKIQNYTQTRKQDSTNLQKIKQLNMIIEGLRTQVQNQKHRCYTLSQEKQCILNMFEEEQELKKTLETQSQTIQSIREDNMKLMELNEQLKHQLYSSKFSQIPNSKMYEILRNKIKNDPQLLDMVRSMMKNYQRKINILQQDLVEIQAEKDRITNCSKDILTMLKNTNINSETIEEEILKFCNLNIQQTRIQRLLKQIRSFSVGIDKWEITEMEQELDQYVVLLRSRNQAIKQVQNQDGSSVHNSSISQVFTQDL